MRACPTTSAINPPAADRYRELNECVRHHAADGDDGALKRFLHHHWPVEDLARVLNGGAAETARSAAYCLGVNGGPAVVVPLLRALHHDDATVASSAEDAMWRIWFNAAGSGIRRQLVRAAEMMNDGRFDSALTVLECVLHREPNFAEAYHQRAMVRFCVADYLDAVADYKRALRLNAFHFGALSGMGHAHAQLGQPYDALRCFREALKIHPRMDGLRQSIRRVLRMTGQEFRMRD